MPLPPSRCPLSTSVRPRGPGRTWPLTTHPAGDARFLAVLVRSGLVLINGPFSCLRTSGPRVSTTGRHVNETVPWALILLTCSPHRRVTGPPGCLRWRARPPVTRLPASLRPSVASLSSLLTRQDVAHESAGGDHGWLPFSLPRHRGRGWRLCVSTVRRTTKHRGEPLACGPQVAPHARWGPGSP